MRTFKRICIETHTVTAQNGDALTVLRGREYFTSDENEDGTVTVFASFWAPVPISVFAGARIFTEA